MADVRVISNSSLPQSSGTPARKPNPTPGIWSKVADVTNGLTRPFVNALRWGRYAIAPAEEPREALERIDRLANDGIRKAATKGISTEQTAASIQSEFTAIAKRHASNGQAQVDIGSGPVAHLPNMPDDPEVTRAPTLQTRRDATDWKDQMKINEIDLCNKASAFTALCAMASRAGIPKDMPALRRLAFLAADTRNGRRPPSLWSLFTSHYQLSFFQKFKIVWYYWFIYQTSIINNFIEAYMSQAIKNLTKDLTSQNSDARSLLNKKIITNANEFLTEDLQITEEFAYGRAGTGNLAHHRNRVIEQHYNFSLPELCAAFSEKRVQEDAPHVEFFRHFKQLPFIGLVFRTFEWLINRVIIQKYMRSWILPGILQSGVEKGLQSTQAHNLPFTLAWTKFLVQRLEQLKDLVDRGALAATSNQPTQQLPGTEGLGDVIKLLLKSLELQPYNTSDDLRAKFEELKKGKWLPDKLIEEAIQKGVADSGNLLFKYLNEAAESGEIFARLLELSAAPFSADIVTEEVMRAQYEAEQDKLETIAGEVFDTIIRESIAKVVNGSKPEGIKEKATQSYRTRSAMTHRTIDRLVELCETMSEKITRAANAPDENNIQQEIAAFLQIMQVFAKQKELKEEFASLSAVDRDAIWRLVTPIYEKAAQIQQRLLTLQDLQEQYPAMAGVERQFRLITTVLDSIGQQFQKDPRHLQNQLIQTLYRAQEDIARRIGPQAKATVKLKEYIQTVSHLTESISREQKAIDALIAFYPPRLPGEDVEREGLLDQLLNYQRGVHPPGFKPRLCLNEIAKYLEYFPEAERRELAALIGNGSNLKANWARLGEVLQRIYGQHNTVKRRDLEALNFSLQNAGQWIQGKIGKFSLVKDQDHAAMQAEIRAVSAELSVLKKDAEKARLTLPANLHSWGIHAGTAAYSTALATLGGVLGGPVGTAIGAGVGAFASKWAYPETQSDSEFAKSKGVYAKVVGAGVGMAATYFGVPAALSAAVDSGYMNPINWAPDAARHAAAAAGTAYLGWSGKKAVHTALQDKTYPKVMAIFRRARAFMFEERVYKAAATRALKELS